MALPKYDSQRLSRRALLRQLGAAPLLLRPAPLFGSFLFGRAEQLPTSAFPLTEARLSPHYPVKSALDGVLRLVAPGSDEYLTEGYAHEIGLVLEGWAQSLKRSKFSDLKRCFSPSLQAASLRPTKEVALRSSCGVDSFRREYSKAVELGADRFLRELETWIGSELQVERAEFETTSIEEVGALPLIEQLCVRYDVLLFGKNERREQWIGSWLMNWLRSASEEGSTTWQLARLEPLGDTRSVSYGSAFVDVTREALGSISSFNTQMSCGSDYWRTVLDGACGIDVYGNNGVAIGDFDNDGFDDLYVCQPAGLPNRLYRNRGDGTFDDMTEKAGVGVLDNTACALFADFRNSGLQDLLVVCGGGPLLFLNQGDGSFSIKRDAFQFAQPPQGTFTHAALADYDCDGRLDVYFCVYSYYLGLDQYHYPIPYFDAQNGPPNFLFHNEGDGKFADRTEAAGLNAENNRYSFACAWGEIGLNGMPDLYVVNDFGRNNLYRSNGNGTFRAVSEESHVEDVGAGMSASWVDYNNDQRTDLYVANMWSAAGQRVSQQALFHANATESIRDLYRRHARGNALYRNTGNGAFENVSKQAGVEVGRWAWCSDTWDFDQDGYSDLYVTNGYISAPGWSQADLSNSSARSDHGVDKQPDLASFFWRQVVANSPNDAVPSLAYEVGWNALNELIRSDSSWSGHERNVMLANNRDGTFSEVSGVVGLDFIEDGRSFALADFDRDGRLEIVLKNRNAPQLRILHNAMKDVGDSIAFRLRGTKSNRDAIGAAIVLIAGTHTQTKYLQAGSGFLAQHSKEVSFGLGKNQGPISATVRWPSGVTQEFEKLPLNSLVHLEEGLESFTAAPFNTPHHAYGNADASKASIAQEPVASVIETWLLDPLRAPAISLVDLAGGVQTLDSTRGRFTLLHFWATTSKYYLDQLNVFQQHRAALTAADLSILAINVDPPYSVDKARLEARVEAYSYPVLFATEEITGVYNIIYRYLFDRRRDLGIPSSFLLDREGMLVKLYQGALDIGQLIADVRSIPMTRVERVRRALPFAGTLYQGQFLRNDFTYGVAMFQHGYFDQAAESFQQVVATRPDDAEGYYNLGTLDLRRRNFSAARKYLQQALKLKPNYPEAWNNLGMIAAQEGVVDQAIQNFRQALRLRPSYATVLLNLGNLYRRQQSFVEAEDCLKRAVDLQPNDPEANYSLGMLFAQEDMLQPASDYLQKALRLRPDYPEALNNLGVIFVREQRYAEAEQQFRTCIRTVPGFEGSYLNLARLYIVQDEKQKAREALQDLIRLRPESDSGKLGLQLLNSLR